MKTNEKKYNNLVGLTKKEIISELGQEFNYYHSDLWNYEIRKKFFRGKEILYLVFENERVIEIFIKR
jgi:hypothetical protein